jgi:hypothetical protein
MRDERSATPSSLISEAVLQEWASSLAPAESTKEEWRQQVQAWRKAEPSLAERPFSIVAEKILSGQETLPKSWPIHGTSGYDFLNDLNRLFVEAENARAMKRVYERFTRQTPVARTGSAAVSYSHITNLVLTGGSGNNTYNVLSTLGLYPTSLNTGSGVDTVNVQSTTGPLSIVSAGGGGLDTVNVGNAGSVQGILGAVTVTNLVSFTRLNVDDSSDPNPRNVTLSASGLTGILSGLAPAPIDYATTAVNSLTVRGGSGGNTFTITALLVPTTLDTGTGGDTVHVLGTVTPLTIDSGAATRSLSATAPPRSGESAGSPSTTRRTAPR